MIVFKLECIHVRPMAIYVEKIPNRNSPPAILIRKAWREGKRIRRQTLANISKLPRPPSHRSGPFSRAVSSSRASKGQSPSAVRCPMATSPPS